MRLWLFIGAINGALAVFLGALGAHALDPSLGVQAFEIFDTAVRYHFIHSLALIAVALLSPHLPRGSGGYRLAAAGVAFTAGIVLFCGGLYVLVGFGMAIGAQAAPVGGILFILGWLLLAATAFAMQDRHIHP
ncbi:MAG TPA: DUF423 domain-containing protein [Alphaproteobacteria bacterium]|jgi:uncharacterized membrane protein YgdD (TMEM256/DUF423 family)|nr:DUF423 domain-containing protein [Alphaproteobacteria bacterium]